MPDRYDTLQESCDTILREILPQLTVETVDRAVEAMNNIVCSIRPANWAFCDEPAEILGITSDQERVAYRKSGRLGLYRALPFDRLHQRISGMVAEARKDYELESIRYDFSRRATSDQLKHTEGLLDRLVALKK